MSTLQQPIPREAYVELALQLPEGHQVVEAWLTPWNGSHFLEVVVVQNRPMRIEDLGIEAYGLQLPTHPNKIAAMAAVHGAVARVADPPGKLYYAGEAYTFVADLRHTLKVVTKWAICDIVKRTVTIPRGWRYKPDRAIAL